MNLLVLAFVAVAAALNPSCNPGGNFDLSKWNLQLPTGNPGSPTTISASQLQGCSGFSSNVFYTDGSSGELVMTVPGSPSSAGCVTTPNSLHCRTEFREINPSSWSPNAGSNRLKVTLSVPRPDNSGHGTCIGQIHIDDSISSKPVTELFYNSAGLLAIGVERTRAGGELLFTNLATIPVGNTFTYEIRYESGQLSVGINGAFTNLNQYELNNPNSYFKVGNYNQGDSYSEVRIQSISVTHGSKPATSAHAISTISAGGIGPRETIYALDATIKPYPSPTGACAAAPTKYSDNTVNLRLFYEDNCCHEVETAHIGTFNVCHNANGPFSSIEQAVGANLFDRGIHIEAYEGTDCSGGSKSFSLSNSKGCQAAGSGNAGYLSFKISEPATCAVTGPGVQGDNLVTMELYSDIGCCSSFETIKMGTLSSCHNANQDFHGFSQSVGKNEFGWNIHIHTFTQEGCQGSSDQFSLTNAATCNKNGIAWKSFMIEMDCARHDLTTKNDNTVSLALYRDGNCCVFNGEDIDLGTLGTCHNANANFGSITQAVGQNMFGRKIHIEVFTGRDCTGTKKEHSLTNADNWCGATGNDEAYQSFRISEPAPVCEWRTPPNTNANTVTIETYTDLSCCDWKSETTIGVADTCHNAPSGGVRGLGINPGSSWTDGSYLVIYSERDCGGDARYFSLVSDLKDICGYGLDPINSYRLVKPAASPPASETATQTETQSSAPEPTHPSTCPDDWVGVGYSQSTGVVTGPQGTWGTIYWNGCDDVTYGAAHSWCKGDWLHGWNVDCDGSGAPTSITGPRGNYGNCFQLYRDCSATLGVASFYGFEYYCCSPV
ncbi:alginate lyase-domain-containing protein [Aspergillus karnatakaensis]|uniref:polysaccharide lyase family 7 protein n=1 Tax=Aspergillus karnatakaensis TaxID=1810916 RepID=UPI003CCD3256